MSKARGPRSPRFTARPRLRRELEIIQANLVKKSRHFGIRELLTGRLRARHDIRSWHRLLPASHRHQRHLLLSADHLRASGGELSTSFAQSVLVGLVNVGMTFVAIWLIDRLGRKPLLGIGLTGHDACRC